MFLVGGRNMADVMRARKVGRPNKRVQAVDTYSGSLQMQADKAEILRRMQAVKDGTSKLLSRSEFEAELRQLGYYD
jgi:hypothetical protein